jgi:hypothetical protein
LSGSPFVFVSIPKLPRQYPWVWAPSIPQREHVKNFSGRVLEDVPVEPPDFMPSEPVEEVVTVPEDDEDEVPELPCWLLWELLSPWTFGCALLLMPWTFGCILLFRPWTVGLALSPESPFTSGLLKVFESKPLTSGWNDWAISVVDGAHAIRTVTGSHIAILLEAEPCIFTVQFNNLKPSFTI